jgi:hypothetical protein
MDGPHESRSARSLDAFLAGLQAGTLGTLWMLAWSGMGSAFVRRSFWMPEDLLATVLHPRSGIAVDFGWSTISGLALYVVIYGLLGAGFAVAARRVPMRRARTTLLALIWALVWYYILFHFAWKTISPPIALLDLTRATVVGHLIYGLVLARFDTHIPRPETHLIEPAVVQLPVEASSPEPRA